MYMSFNNWTRTSNFSKALIHLIEAGLLNQFLEVLVQSIEYWNYFSHSVITPLGEFGGANDLFPYKANA